MSIRNAELFDTKLHSIAIGLPEKLLAVFVSRRPAQQDRRDEAIQKLLKPYKMRIGSRRFFFFVVIPGKPNASVAVVTHSNI